MNFKRILIANNLEYQHFPKLRIFTDENNYIKVIILVYNTKISYILGRFHIIGALFQNISNFVLVLHVSLTYRKQNMKTREQIAKENKIFNLVATTVIILVLVGIGCLINKCTRSFKNHDVEYSEEYWENVAVEKMLRKEGLEQEADRVRNYRLDNLMPKD